MKSTYLAWIFGAVATLVILTLLGAITGFRPILVLCGLLIFSVCIIIAVNAHSLAEWLKKLSSWLKAQPRGSYDTLANVLVLLTEGSLIVRAIFFSASKWTVDFYLSLCKGGLSDFGQQIYSNLFLSFLMLALAGFDLSRKKSIKSQGLPTRILTVYGLFQAIKGLILLVFALEPSIFEKLEILFSWRFWFLDTYSRYEVWGLLRSEGGLALMLIWPLFGISFVMMGIQVARTPTATDDAKNFGLACAAINAWMVVVPISFLIVFIHLLSTK